MTTDSVAREAAYARASTEIAVQRIMLENLQARAATRAAEGDVIAKLEMIKDEFEEIALQVGSFSQDEKNELKRKFSDVSEDIGDALC